MNERLKELMLEAGYAAPELAGRAKVLAELLVKDCATLINDATGRRGSNTYGALLKKRYGVEE